MNEEFRFQHLVKRTSNAHYCGRTRTSLIAKAPGRLLCQRLSSRGFRQKITYGMALGYGFFSPAILIRVLTQLLLMLSEHWHSQVLLVLWEISSRVLSSSFHEVKNNVFSWMGGRQHATLSRAQNHQEFPDLDRPRWRSCEWGRAVLVQYIWHFTIMIKSPLWLGFNPAV